MTTELGKIVEGSIIKTAKVPEPSATDAGAGGEINCLADFNREALNTGRGAGAAMQDTPIGRVARSGLGGAAIGILRNPWVSTIIAVIAGLKGITSFASGNFAGAAIGGGLALLFGSGGVEKFFGGLREGSLKGESALNCQGNNGIARLDYVGSIQGHDGAAARRLVPENGYSMLSGSPSLSPAG